MDRLSGKIALVTGAGDGIAGAITEELVKAGVTVYGCDIVVKKQVPASMTPSML